MKKIGRYILIACLSAIAVVYLAFYLNFKYYWHDETIIFLHLSGYGKETLVKNLYDGQIKTQQDLHQFQGVNSEKGLTDTLTSLAATSPHQPPAYFTLLWSWSKLFGKSELALRSLSIIIWLGMLLGIYYLSSILFENTRIASIATILMAISPRFINYAVDVWEYGLFAFCTIWSSFLLLKALASQKSVLTWIAYGVILTLGLYTHIFFIFIVLAHLIYFGFNHSTLSRINRNRYFLTLGIAVILYIPWLNRLIQSQSGIYAWAAGGLILPEFFNKWLNNIPGLFYELNLSTGLADTIKYIILVMLLASLYLIIKTRENNKLILLILLVLVPFVPLALYDIIWGAKYSTVGRFYVPTLIGIILLISFGLGRGINATNLGIKSVSYLGLLSFITLGLISKTFPSQESEKYKGYGSEIINTSSEINQAQKPLVMGENWLDILPLSFKLKETTNYLLITDLKDVNNLKQLNDYNVYIIKPSASLKKEIKRANMVLEQTSYPKLWKVLKKGIND